MRTIGGKLLKIPSPAGMVPKWAISIPPQIIQKAYDFAITVVPTTVAYVAKGGQSNLFKLQQDYFVSKLTEYSAEKHLKSQGCVFLPGGRTDWNVYTTQKTKKTAGKSFKEDLLVVFPNRKNPSKINVKGSKDSGKYKDSWTFQFSSKRCDPLFVRPKSVHNRTKIKLSEKILNEGAQSNLLIGVSYSKDAIKAYKLLAEGKKVDFQLVCSISLIVPIKTLYEQKLFDLPVVDHLRTQKRVVYLRDVRKKVKQISPYKIIGKQSAKKSHK